MKKLVKVFAVILVLCLGLCSFTACADNSGLQSEIDNLKQQLEKFEDLAEKQKDQITGLEDQITDLEDKVGEKENVFWTAKAEYAETEPMTVYYSKNAVFSIKFNHANAGSAGIGFNMNVESFMADIYAGTIMQTLYFEWDNGVLLNSSKYDGNYIFKKGVPADIGGGADDADGALANATYFNLVVCVPGTPFPLACFKNVTVNRQ